LSQNSITRRNLLKDSVTLAIGSSTIVRAAETALPSMMSGMDKDLKQRWVAIAESLKPNLQTITERPRAVVRLTADASQYLRWRVTDEGTEATLREHLFRRGEEFTLDFGGHRAGHLEFLLEGVGKSIDAPCRLRFTFGEVPGDVAEPLFPYKGQLSSAWLPVETVTIDFLPQTVRLPRRYAFRFVKVEVLDTSPNYGARFSEFKAVGLTSASEPSAPTPGAQPKHIKDIDEVSLRTLRDCMQTTFEDGPRRDQRLWIGDLRLQARANYLTFKNNDLVKRCLYLFAGLSRESDGFLPACVFEKPAPLTTDTFILDYAALYGAVVLDYARATHDMATAKELYPVARRQLDLLLATVEDGVYISPKDQWAFIDWSRELDRDASMQGVIIYSLKRLQELAILVGATADAARFPSIIQAMEKAGRSKYYDAASGVCISGPNRQRSWASQAWLTLSGSLSKEEAATALRKVVLEDQSSVKPATPYLYHHVVEAMIETGMFKEALGLIEEYWGGMVKAGADTFWEAYDPNDSTFSPYGDVHIDSFCHAWSCTPAFFFRMHEGVLLTGI
jgi:alpha-L-rhamnosidase